MPKSTPSNDARSPHPDPFIEGFLSSQDDTLAASFTAEQLRAIQLAFGARGWRRHPIDVRRSVKLWRWRFYVVLLAGRERRQLDRLDSEGMLSRAANAVATALGLFILALPFALLAYALKTALGVDLVADGGLHATLAEAKAQIRQMFGY